MSKTESPYTWNPDPQTGLSGDTYLSVAIEDHVSDLSEAHSPGVYVLELSIPEIDSHEAHHRLWLTEFNTVPNYLEQIIEAPKLLYVGAAKDVYTRIQSHLENPNQSTSLAKVFPIHSIRYIDWCDSTDEAFRKENRVAIDLSNNVTGYVHSR